MWIIRKQGLRYKFIFSMFICFLLALLLLVLHNKVLLDKNYILSSGNIQMVGAVENEDGQIISLTDDPQLIVSGVDTFVNELRINLDEPPSRKLDMQIFYSVDGVGFTEENSIRKTLSTQDTSLTFVVNKKISKLRIDFASEKGIEVCLKEIKINPTWSFGQYCKNDLMPLACLWGIFWLIYGVYKTRTYSNDKLIKWAFLFFAGNFILFCRYTEPFFYPNLYAEDGVWTSYLMGKSIMGVSFDTRGFPILGNVMLLMPGWILIKTGIANLEMIPIINAVVVNSFMSVIAASLIYFLTDHNKKTAYTFWLIFLLVPVGDDNWEIFGRALNVHFFYPAWLCVALLWAIKKNKYDFKVFLVELMAIATAFSMPVGLGFIGMFLLMMLWKNKHFARKIILEYRLLVITFVIGLTIIPFMFNSAGGATGLEFNYDDGIEFVFARTILFALISSMYSHLNDIVVVLLFLCMCVIVMKSLLNGEKRFDLAWSLGCALLYAGAFLITRGGLSSLLNGYSITFPDRYFTGINIMFLLVLMLAIESISNRRIYNIFIGGVLMNCLLSPGEFMLFEKPVYESVGVTFAERIELAKQNDGVINIPPKGWKMEVPLEYLK